MVYFSKIYKALSVIVFNTLIIFISLNLLCWVYLKWTYEEQDVDELYDLINYQAYQYGELDQCTDSLEIVDRVNKYLDFIKSGGQEFIYHPSTEYQLANFDLDFLSMTNQEDGFNIRQSARREKIVKNKKIYCFGGSTTFGALVNNEETWPFFLQEILDSIEVKNYGVPGFVPTQETNQFIYLLKSGYRPSLSIFMDGVNIGPPYDGSDFSKKIYQKFAENNLDKHVFREVIAELPIVKLLQNRPLQKPIDLFRTEDIDFAEIGLTDTYNEKIIQRFVSNALIRQQIATLFNVEIVQFLQPSAAYAYSPQFMTDKAKERLNDDYTKKYNKNVRHIYDEVIKADCGYHALTQLFESYNYPAIVDFVHYSPGFNKYLAKSIIDSIFTDTIILNNFEYFPELSTGTPFKLESN